MTSGLSYIVTYYQAVNCNEFYWLAFFTYVYQ